jgi:hypothetical protein
LTSAQFSGPGALAIDSSGYLWVVDTGNNVLRKVNLTSGVILAAAGNQAVGAAWIDGAATATAAMNGAFVHAQ